MRRLVSMLSIVVVLGSMVGTTNYQVSKAADTVTLSRVKTTEVSTYADKHILGDFVIQYEEGYGDEDKGVWYIADYTGNSSKVIIPDTFEGNKIEKISSWVFYNHTELEEIQLPNSLKVIDENAFRGCTNLKKIDMSNKLETINKYAFQGCKNLEKIQLPQTLHRVYSSSFKDTGIKEFTIDNKNSTYTTVDGVIYNKKCTQLIVVPPQKSKLKLPKTVTKINNYAALGNKQLTEVKFPASLKTIGDGAFRSCTSLKKVKFPNTLKTISWDAFGDCRKVDNIYIPASVTDLDKAAFSGCNSIKTFKISNKNKKYSVSDGNLYNKSKTIFYTSVTNKKTVTLPKSVRKLAADNSFDVCSRDVEKIKVAKGNKYFSIYDDALYDYKKTRLYFCPGSKENIILPATLTNIGMLDGDDDDVAILMSPNLKKIQVKAANKKFSSYKGALYDKKQTELLLVPGGITNIVLPKTLKDASELRYSIYSDNITSIEVDVGNKDIQVKDGILYNKNLTEVLFCIRSKEKVVLPKTVKKIEEKAFSGCKKLKNITFSENLEFVDDLAFEDCSSLEYAKFPEKAVSVWIGTLAFVNCSQLKWVYVPKGVYFRESWEEHIFAGCNNLSDIYYAGTKKQWEKCWEIDGIIWKEYSGYRSKVEATFFNLTIHYGANAPL